MSTEGRNITRSLTDFSSFLKNVN
uniref:Uncharacterized protein n=1 Tax=Arundo donax TaxID=35708 RepID=A0A0A8Z999_ARUDO